jgi:hypothetical protein
MRVERGAAMEKVFGYLRRHHVGLLALFIAMGGTAYAASLPRNSVGTAQLKNAAVTSSKVKDRSLRSKDVRAGQLPRGPRGLQGTRGPEGPVGPQGPTGLTGHDETTNAHRTGGSSVAVAAGTTRTTTATCPFERTAVSGGGFSTLANATLTDSFPTHASPNTWQVKYRNDTAASDTVRAWVICTS